MSALTFDKKELGNLEYSLQREMLSTDRLGGYMSTTIVCCNTSKYHGLMVSPIDSSDNTYVLLSSLDETIVQHDHTFNLALHRFKGAYEPRGHKYITDFVYTPTPSITYRVGGVILKKEMLWIHKRTQLMIKYTLVDAHSDTKLRLRPFLAFRNKHALSKANMEADGYSYPAINGVKCKLYPSFPWLYIQTNRENAEFVPAPDWYYGFEYQDDLTRGYDGHEDLLTTGYFEIDMKKGESVIFSASTDEMGSARTIDEVYEASIARRTHKVDFLSCLRHSARQFVIRHGKDKKEVLSGYPWGDLSGREALISLPGITLEQGNKEDCIDALDALVSSMQNGMFTGNTAAINSVDAPLWFFWTLQELQKKKSAKFIWDQYGEAMKSVLSSYKKGFGDRVALHDNGLIWSNGCNAPLTWMNSIVDGVVATPRCGYVVEVNALWYNAVCYTLELASKYKNSAFVKEWSDMPELIKSSFVDKFWLKDGSYLADSVDMCDANRDIRSNMIVACGLDYKIISEEQQLDVIRVVRQHLLTPKGIRSLTPISENYKGSFEKLICSERDYASKNGMAWVWPLQFYVKACFDTIGVSFLPIAMEIINNFDDDIQTHGIGCVSELYDSDPPYTTRGAVSSAWSTGAVLYIHSLIQEYSAMQSVGSDVIKKDAKKSAKPKKEVKDSVSKVSKDVKMGSEKKKIKKATKK